MKKSSKLSGTVPFLFSVLVAALGSCGDRGGGNGGGNGGNSEQPWDKTRTARVHVVSDPSGGSLFPGTDYQAVIDGMLSTDCHATLLDRTDVRFTADGMVNPGVTVALRSGKVPLFVPIGTVPDGYAGSTVLLDKPLNSLEQIRATDHCWLMKHEVEISTTVRMRLSTISFNDEGQIAPGVSAIKGIWTLQTLVVGVIEHSLIESFESAVSSAVTAGHVFELVDSGGDYRVYVLGSARWKLREVTPTVKSGNIEGFLIQVEYLK